MFLHGYLSSKEAFAAQIAYFSRFYRVTALDFLGQGASGTLTEAYSVDDYAAWTERVLADLGVRNPWIVAHSFGCRVAVKMAKRGKIPLQKMVLTGPAGVVLPRSASYRRRVRAYRFVKKFAPRFAERHFGSAEYRTLSPIMRESYKKIVNEDLRGDAACIQGRVLMIVGKEDTVTPLKEAQAYLAVMRDANIAVMDGGHFAFAQHPLVFNLLVEDFLQDV